MKPAKTALAIPGSVHLIVVSLFTAVIDIAVFQFLYIQPDSLAIAHIASFLTASAVGYFSISFWPSHDAGNKTRSNPLRFCHVTTFVLIALLVMFLRGGLLASLLNIMAIPALAAISISAIFSSASLYATYLYFQHTSNLPVEPRWGYLCLGVVAYTTLLKLFYLGVPELIFEEAYYWNYAQHLDIGYLDHPLIVAWIIKAFTSLMGDIEFAVRLGAFLCWFVTAYYSYKLTKEVFNKSIAYCALVIVAVLPAYFSFGWFMSPDAPLTACWAAATYYIHQVIVRDHKKSWLGVGIAIGLGMSSKYTIALLGAAIVLFLLFDRNARKWLYRPEPYIALAIAFILFSPVIIWNIQHDWLSFTFQSQGRLTSSHSFSLPRFISNLLIFLTPTGLLTVIAITLFRKNLLSVAEKSHALAIGTLARSYLLLGWLTLFPVAVFASLSLFRASKLNWTGPCWLGLIPFVAVLITQKPDSGTPRLLAWCQRAWPATIAILLFIYGASFHYLGIGFPRVPYPQNVHLIGWQDFGRDIDVLATKLERETGAQVLIVGMDRNKIASGLAFYRAKYLNSSAEKATHDPAMHTASTHLFGGNGLMYELWFPVEKQNNKTMLLVSEDIKDLTDEDVLSRVQTAGEIKDIKTWKNGKQTGHYYYRLVAGYHGKPVASKPDGSRPID